MADPHETQEGGGWTSRLVFEEEVVAVLLGKVGPKTTRWERGEQQAGCSRRRFGTSCSPEADLLASYPREHGSSEREDSVPKGITLKWSMEFGLQLN